MMNLNLVSQELKQETKLRHIYTVLRHIAFVLIIITIFIAIIVLTAKIILQNNFNKIVEQTTLITKNSQGRNFEIRNINLYLSYIDKVQKKYLQWSFLIDEISKYVNNDIIFNNIEFSADKNIISLQGIAKQRNALLSLKEGLEESSLLTDINFPLTNILEKENIIFNITAKIALNKFQNISHTND